MLTNVEETIIIKKGSWPLKKSVVKEIKPTFPPDISTNQVNTHKVNDIQKMAALSHRIKFMAIALYWF